MIKPNTPFSTWTRMQGYPKGSRQEGSLTATDKFYVLEADFDVTDLQNIEGMRFESLYIMNSSFDMADNGEKVYVTVLYGRPTVENKSTAREAVTESTLDDGGTELPIGLRKQNESLYFPNYKTKWNYKLSAANGITLTPAYWTSATDTVIPNDDSAKYKWVKDSAESGWHILKKATKKVETVLVPSAVVTETTKFRTYNSAVAKRSTTGTKETPRRRFKLSGDWLVVSSNINYDGKHWVCQTRFQNAPEWDADLYL